MNFKELKGRLGELPGFFDPDRGELRYHPGTIILNRYEKGPVRVACRYSEKSVSEGGVGGDGDEFLLLAEIFEDEESVEEVLDEKESEEVGSVEVFYGYLPEFPPVKRLIEEQECNFLSWTGEGGKEVWTLLNLRRNSGNTEGVEDVDELPGLKSLEDSKEDEKLKELFREVRRRLKMGDGLESPFLLFGDYLPVGVGGWELVTAFLMTRTVQGGGRTFVLPRIQGNYEKEGDYLNLQYDFVFSFLPESLDRSVKPPKGRNKTEVDGKTIYRKKDQLSYWDGDGRFSVRVLSPEENKEVDGGDMESLMEKALEELDSYSCHGASMRFVSRVKDLYGEMFQERLSG